VPVQGEGENLLGVVMRMALPEALERISAPLSLTQRR